MIVALLTHAGDIRQAQSLIQWIARLGKVNAPLLLVCDRDTPFDQVLLCQKFAESAFTDFHIAANPVATKGWPEGPHSLFKAACEAVYKRFQQPFLLLEPDAIPLHPNWFTEIKGQYNSGQWAYMGHIYQGTQNFIGERFMSGIAVYPQGAFSSLSWEHVAPWDVLYRTEFVNSGTHTDLIYHFFGQMDGGVRFISDAREPQSPREKHLDWLPDKAVLFHRDKTQSLIPLLKKKLFNESGKLIDVVFPVHAGDIAQAIHHAVWLRKLHTKQSPHNAVVSFDRATPINEVATFTNILRECFHTVTQFSYPRPPIPGYPASANWMFQNTALHMRQRGHPWLLLEADACVLCADWLERLQDAYDSCGQSFFGPFVKGMHHLNGSMIYPPDAPERIPSAMHCVNQAWDYECGPEMRPQASDASDLMQHCWTILNGEACEVGGGDMPQNITEEQARRWIRKSAVIFHRLKGNSLIDLLHRGWKP